MDLRTREGGWPDDHPPNAMDYGARSSSRRSATLIAVIWRVLPSAVLPVPVFDWQSSLMFPAAVNCVVRVSAIVCALAPLATCALAPTELKGSIRAL